MYSGSLEESARKVAASRQRRLGETVARLGPQAKTDLLAAFHPDFRTESMRELLVGANRGERTPLELADLLEGNSRLDPLKIDLGNPTHDVDVLVIGGGGAGASAAITAQENGARVLVATKLRLGDANTVGAQAGTQAADRPNDSPAIHYLDTMGGGHYAGIPDLVETLVKDAPDAIRWLERLGVNWDKEPDGTMHELSGGGTSRRRLHSARDYTGLEEMRVLRDEMRNRGIECLEFAPAIELILDEAGAACGAVLVNIETNETMVVRAKAVILTTGGIGRLHIQGYPTTNHYGATADGLVMAYRAGAHLIYIDTMQYHPTGVAYPIQIEGQLVTEKVRTLGAHLTDADGRQFIMPLEPRDVVSAAIIRECRDNRGIDTPTGQVGVWLDSPMIDLIRGEGTIGRELPAMVRQFARYGIDITREPMLVYPTLHYQNGGIKIGVNGETNVGALFAAGEVSGGVHGRNRLIGNSTLELFVFGRRAGKAAARFARDAHPGPPSLEHVRRWQEGLQHAGLTGSRPTSPLLLPDYARAMPDYTDDATRLNLPAGRVKLA
jgi:succinate dehydrogenase/fumarate reductase flavoprotein subunit